MYEMLLNSILTCLLLLEYVNGAPQINGSFTAIHNWHYLNFSWPSKADYWESFRTQHYIPPNNILTGIKSYQETLYISLPRFFPGTPVTLASLPCNSPETDPLLQPFPNWQMNVEESCNTLQNVYSMEIDTKGIMWVLDGFRINNLTKCPPKIVLLDINNGQIIQVYEVPNELSLHQGGWMNDIVLDESDGGYAYISETSDQDPGVIVFSRKQNRAWKIRDRTMFAELNGEGYVVRGIAVNSLHNVDGIALSPISRSDDKERIFYYTALTGYTIYSISTKILKNESFCRTSEWRKSVQIIGQRPGATDGMVMDNNGNLYFGLLNKYAIAKWNIYKKSFDTSWEKVYENYTYVNWPDTFGMDTYGNLYVTVNGIENIINQTHVVISNDRIRFRILKTRTGTRSYLYP